MTIDQFNETEFRAGMKAKHPSFWDEPLTISSVDFEEKLICLNKATRGEEIGVEEKWCRCENVTIAD